MIMKISFRHLCCFFLFLIAADQAWSQSSANMPANMKLTLLEPIPDHPVYAAKVKVRTLDCLKNCVETYFLDQNTEFYGSDRRKKKTSSMKVGKGYIVDYFTLRSTESRRITKISLAKKNKISSFKDETKSRQTNGRTKPVETFIP